MQALNPLIIDNGQYCTYRVKGSTQGGFVCYTTCTHTNAGMQMYTTKVIATAFKAMHNASMEGDIDTMVKCSELLDDLYPQNVDPSACELIAVTAEILMLKVDPIFEATFENLAERMTTS